MKHHAFHLMLVTFIMVLVLSACQPIRPEVSDTNLLSAEEVVLAAAAGWNDDEVTSEMIEASLAHFATDAVYEVTGLPTGDEIYTGQEEIRAWMTGLLENDFRLTVEILESDGTTVQTETKSWMNWSREAGIAPIVATEEYTVQDGKITHVIWTITQDSLDDLMAVMGGG